MPPVVNGHADGSAAAESAKGPREPFVGNTTTADWRSKPGFISAGESRFEAIHVLLGHFLKDRFSPSPLPEKDLFTDGEFEWGVAAPLEKVLRTKKV